MRLLALCSYHEVVSNLPQGCVPLNYAILLYAYVLLLSYLVVLYSALSLNSGIVTLITVLPTGKKQLMEQKNRKVVAQEMIKLMNS